MHLKTWHAIGLIVAVSVAVTLLEVTRDTRFTLVQAGGIPAVASAAAR